MKDEREVSMTKIKNLRNQPVELVPKEDDWAEEWPI